MEQREASVGKRRSGAPERRHARRHGTDHPAKYRDEGNISEVFTPGGKQTGRKGRT